MVSPDVSYNLDVLCINKEQNRVYIATKKIPTTPINKREEYIFANNGEYTVYVSVSGQGAPTKKATLRFNWQGQWQTATIEKLAET